MGRCQFFSRTLIAFGEKLTKVFSVIFYAIKKFLSFVLNLQYSYYFAHWTYFVVISLIASGFIKLFDRDMSYVDCLFTSISAMTCTGLVTIDFSQTSIPTQVIVFILIIMGNVSVMTLPALFFSRLRGGKVMPNRSSEALRRKGMTLLFFTVLLYIFLSMVIGASAFLIYFASAPSRRQILADYDVNVWWFSIFQSISAFGNAGFCLVVDSLVPFSSSVIVLQISATLILLGNTCFPVVIYVLVQFMRVITHLFRFRTLEGIIKQVLNYPRHHFTHIYPFKRTLWLVGVILFMNAVQIIFMCSMDWSSPILTDTTNPGSESGGEESWSDGLIKMQNVVFQSISTRTAGFNSLVLSAASPTVLLIYIIMMYISSYPVAFSVHQSAQLVQVRSPSTSSLSSLASLKDINITDLPPRLSMKEGEELEQQFGEEGGRRSSYSVSPQKIMTTIIKSEKNQQVIAIQQGISKIIYTDLVIVAISVVLISIVEDEALSSGDLNFSLFTLIFEVVSAYGTVGLSLGYPNAPTSFCGTWRTLSKVFLMFTMLSGRHRSLPASHDLMFGGHTLPSDDFFDEVDEVDAH